LWADVRAADTPEKLAAAADAVAAAFDMSSDVVQQHVYATGPSCLYNLLHNDIKEQSWRIARLANTLVEWQDIFHVIDAIYQCRGCAYNDDIAFAQTDVLVAATKKRLHEVLGAPLDSCCWRLSPSLLAVIDPLVWGVMVTVYRNRGDEPSFRDCYCLYTPASVRQVEEWLHSLIENLYRLVRQPPETDTEAEEADEEANAPEASS
jgi:hypothetical protein